MKQKGVTLIALVITIIVLLILAGVTINMILGNNGIIGQAQKAKETQAIKEKEEEMKLKIADKQVEAMKNKHELSLADLTREGTEEDPNPYKIDGLAEGAGNAYMYKGERLYINDKLSITTEPVIISFELGGVQYTTTEGTTWGEWIDGKAEYSTCDYNHIHRAGNVGKLLKEGTNIVESVDSIKNLGKYSISLEPSKCTLADN